MLVKMLLQHYHYNIVVFITLFKQKSQRICGRELRAFGNCRYVVTQRSRTEISKLVFQYVGVRTMENSPLTNYGRESMTLFSSVPNGSRMNVIWTPAPLLFLPAQPTRVLLFCVVTVTIFAAPPLLSAPGEKNDRTTNRRITAPTDFYLDSVVSIPRARKLRVIGTI